MKADTTLTLANSAPAISASTAMRDVGQSLHKSLNMNAYQLIHHHNERFDFVILIESSMYSAS